MLGVSARKKYVVGGINERYHLNPHIDMYSEDGVRRMAQIVNGWIISFNQGRPQAWNNFVKLHLNNAAELEKNHVTPKEISDFLRIVDIKNDRDRESALYKFLIQSRKDEIGF